MKPRSVLLVLFMLLFVVTGCAKATSDAEKETHFTFDTLKAETTAEAAGETETPEWTYPISREILLDEDDVLWLINRENLLDKDYPDADSLIKTKQSKTTSDTWKVRQITEDALALMFAAAKEDGVLLYIDSAYRSFSTQSTIYNNRLKSNKGVDDGYVQMPGASEHQSGLSVDVVSWAWRDKKLNTDFAKTKEAQWMAENSARFGFIIRYPQGEAKEAITGIRFEPWHIRYVGMEAAMYIAQNDLTLEEFTVESKAALAAFEALLP